VTPGTYEWTWGTGVNQNFTLDAVAAPVPEPLQRSAARGSFAALLVVRPRRRIWTAGLSCRPADLCYPLRGPSNG